MIILGIDPGTARLGWAILSRQNNHDDLIASGSLDTPAHTLLGERLLLIGQLIDTLVSQYHPDCAAVEDLFFARNVTTAIPVAQARGVVLYKLATHQIPATSYTPTKIKSSLTGSGNADKKQVIFMVKQLVKVDPTVKLDDAFDAIAVALTHSQYSSARINS